MKKLALISLSLIFAVSIFGKGFKYQPKVVAIFLGEKSPNFDEERFSDIDFYYVVKEKYKNPEGMLKNLEANEALAFDKNGTLVSYSKDIVSALNMGFSGSNFITSSRGEYTNLDELTKEYVKKGKVMKSGKKFKGKDPQVLTSKYISFTLPDFNLKTADNKDASFNSITKDNPLTLVIIVHLEGDTDGSKGTESGANKSGSQFIKDVSGTLSFDKQLKALISAEEIIFGKDMRR